VIVERLIDVWAAFVTFIAGLLDWIPVPVWFADLPGYVTTVGGYLTGTGVWLPWALLMTVISAWLLALAAALVIRLVRIVASFMTGGGGGAA